jgi:hypothetical protein
MLVDTLSMFNRRGNVKSDGLHSAVDQHKAHQPYMRSSLINLPDDPAKEVFGFAVGTLWGAASACLKMEEHHPGLDLIGVDRLLTINRLLLATNSADLGYRAAECLTGTLFTLSTVMRLGQRCTAVADPLVRQTEYASWCQSFADLERLHNVSLDDHMLSEPKQAWGGEGGAQRQVMEHAGNIQ